MCSGDFCLMTQKQIYYNSTDFSYLLFFLFLFFLGGGFIHSLFLFLSAFPIPGARRLAMMTSSNGNIFRVTGPLCGEFTGPGEFPAQRPVTRSFDVYFDLRPNKRLSKQSWGWWFEKPSCSLWRHRNAYMHGLFTSLRTIFLPTTGLIATKHFTPPHIYA